MSKPASIRLLPEHLIDQIKAGEVIERPANVLKELMENALDAGASKIDIEIKDNGLTLLRVADNGHGIRPNELELAFGRHATSKIDAFEDLYRLSTFGFRGEALPSIASVSKLECVSWTAQETLGGVIRFDGGIPSGVHSANKTGQEHGTVMTIQDLFFNTPARLKFLQSATSEKNWIKKFFYAFALAWPQVSFSLLWDEGERIFYPATDSYESRIKQMFSSKASEKIRIFSAEREWHGVKCRLFNIFTNGARAEGPLEHVTVNGRAVLDKAYGRVVQQILEKHGLTDLPDTLIHLTVPGDLVDVNVHPNKTLVKFHQMGEILSLVGATLREALPEVTRTTTETAQEFSLTKVESPRVDLDRDRSVSYSEHLQRFQQTETPDFTAHVGPQVLHCAAGPFFIWIWPSYATPLYIDGIELLTNWVKNLSNIESERCPLLVSHPLRGIKLSSDHLAKLNQQGFEVDELEENFAVVREIPLWGKGLPVGLLMSIALKNMGIKTTPSELLFNELPLSKWEEAFKSRSVQEWIALNVALDITPQLLNRK